MIEKRNSRPNPYVGPRAFKYGESLYGRDKEVRDILNTLIAERIVLLYSPSGAGKSSLIQAALIPKLEKEEHFRVLPGVKKGKTISSRELRVNSQPPSGAEIHPGINRYVLSALLSIEEGFEPDKQLPLYDLANMDLASYFEQRLFADDKNQFTVLIFDQFEEILTLDPTDVKAKTEFFTQLGAVLGNKNIWALFAMREEYLAGLAPYLFPIPTRLRNTCRLDFLTEESALPAMKQPAIDAGVGFTDDAAKRLINDLRQVKVQLADGTTEDRPGPYIEPVQLQVICRRLWDMIESDDMEIGEDDVIAVGDVTDALAGFYSDQVAVIAVETGIRERVIREWFDQQLITNQGIRGQVLESPGQSQGLDNSVILELVKAHLVRAEKRRNFTWYELAHDRLIRPIKNNNYDWFESNLSPLQRQAELWETGDHSDGFVLRGKPLDDAEKWVKDNEHELTDSERQFLNKCRSLRKRERRDLFLFRMMAVLFILMGATTGYAIYEKVKANKYLIEWKKALYQWKKATELAEKKEKEAEQAKNKAELATQNTIEALSREKLAKEAAQLALHEKEIALARENEAIKETQKQANIALAGDLQGEALERSSEHPDLSLQLSLAANNIHRSLKGEYRLISTLSRIPRQLVGYFRGHRKPVWRLAFRPDGKRLASADEEGTVLLWNTNDMWPAGHPLTGHKGLIHSLSFSPAGDILLTIDNRGTLRLWDAERENVIYKSPDTEVYLKAAFSPEGSLLAACTNEGPIRFFEVPTPNNNYSLHFLFELPSKERISSIVFSPDGKIMASAFEGNIALWDMKKRALIGSPFQAHSKPIWRLAFSSDGKTLASCSSDHSIILWDLQDPEQPRHLRCPLTGHTDTVTEVAFGPDDRVICSASGDKSIRIWDTSTGKQIGRPLVGHDSAILSLNFSNNRSLLASGDMDGTIIVWDFYAPNRLGTTIAGRLAPVRSVSFSPEGQQIASAGQDNTAILWNVATQQQEGTPLRHGEDGSDTTRVTSLVFNPNENILYTASEDNVIRIWDTKKHELKDRSMKHEAAILSLALGRAGKILVSGDDQNNIIIWDPLLKKQIHKLPPGHSKAIWSLALNKNDTILASGSDDKSICLWDVKSGNQIGSPLTGHSGRVSTMTFSPLDDFTFFSASKDEIIRWDLSVSPPERHFLPKYVDPNINSMAFSPDGKMLAVGGGTGVTFINPITGASIFTPDKSGYPIWALSFDRSGKTVVAGDADGTMRLWNPRTGMAFGLPMQGHHVALQHMTQSADGSLLAFSSGDNKVQVIQIDKQREFIEPLELDKDDKISAMIFNPDKKNAKQLITASGHGKSRIIAWNLSVSPPSRIQIANEKEYISCLTMSPNGMLLAGGGQGVIHLWDLGTNPPKHFQLPGHWNSNGNPMAATSLAFGMNGNLLVSGSLGEIILWDVVEKKIFGSPITEIGTIKDNINSIVFSPHGSKLAAAWTRGDILLIDIYNPRDWHRLKGHTGPVNSLSFSGDERILASGSTDNTIRLWDTDSGRPLGQAFMRHKDAVTNVTFSSDNKRIITAGKDGFIMSWDIDIAGWKRRVNKIVAKQLSELDRVNFGIKDKDIPIDIETELINCDLLALTGDKDKAKLKYQYLISLLSKDTSSKDLNNICWYGSLEGFANIVLPACKQAVATARPEDINNYRDTRGLAQAMLDPPDIRGAIEDFQAFVRWSEQYQAIKLNTDLKRQCDKRRQWISTLQEGRIPFDEETLHDLRNERVNY